MPTCCAKHPCHVHLCACTCRAALSRSMYFYASLEPRGPSQQAELVEGPLGIYEELEIVYESEPL
eukprot:6974664-Heterocapsa_arctica.AAC.1